MYTERVNDEFSFLFLFQVSTSRVEDPATLVNFENGYDVCKYGAKVIDELRNSANWYWLGAIAPSKYMCIDNGGTYLCEIAPTSLQRWNL